MSHAPYASRWRRRAGGLVIVLLLPFLLGCAGESGDGSDEIALEPTATIAPLLPPTPIPSAAATTAPPMLAGVAATTLDLAVHRPNELGHIPILMYHAFTDDEANLDEWTVTPETFRSHLAWLHAHDFAVVPLVDLINNEIAAPPGKHPVVITFDDASSRQFRLLRDDDGALSPAPRTAVGVMEAFYADHPDFGRGGVFAVVPTNCFRYEGAVTTCDERLDWLASHGYEIANHTWWHENLHTVSDELFREQVGKTKIWIDERVPGRANLGNVLFLPFGEWPRDEGQVHMLREGFVYGGQDIILAGIVEVGGGLSPSPSSGEWSRRSINRINTDPETWARWTGRIEAGEVTVYTSDGNPRTVTIPEEIPADLAPQWDPEWASDYGMRVVRYPTPGDTQSR